MKLARPWADRPAIGTVLRLRLGRRGAILTTLGLTYLLIGLGALILPASTSTLYLLIPDVARSLLWFAAGGLAVVYAWRHSDRSGWVALFIPPTIRGVAYLIAWLGGEENAWYQAVINLPFIVIVLICSGWREESRKVGRR